MVKTKKKEKKTKEIIIVVLSVLVVVLASFFVCLVVNLKDDDDAKRLALHNHLMSKYIEASCNGRFGSKGFAACGMIDEGVSQDGDVYAEFWVQKYDSKLKPQGERKTYKLYFQTPKESWQGYAEALGE